jgi:hypothetical protein
MDLVRQRAMEANAANPGGKSQQEKSEGELRAEIQAAKKEIRQAESLYNKFLGNHCPKGKKR